MIVQTVCLLNSLFCQSPVVIAGGGIDAPKEPQVAVSSDGAVHLTFGDGERVYYARSKQVSPLSFSKPRKVADVPNLSLGMRRGPRVASAKGTILISAIGGAKGKGRDGDLLVWRSVDSGKTWKGPSKVNDVPAAAREGLHAMAASADGNFACTWLDLRTKRTELRVATSKDGAKWSENALAYRSPTGPICECCHPSLLFDEKGRLHLLWRNSIEGSRDMYRAVSTDDGLTFEEAQKLGAGSWKLNACPMDGGAIAVQGATISTAWRREHIVYATHGTDDREVRLGDGEQPTIAATYTGPVVAWLKRRPGTLLVKRGTTEEPTILAEDATDPVAATDGTHVIIAWEGKAKGRPSIEARLLQGQGP